MSQPKNPFECFSKLRIEYSVDDGVEAWVDVAKESGNLECNVARWGVQVVLDTESIQYIACEEGDPTYKETSWQLRYIL